MQKFKMLIKTKGLERRSVATATFVFLLLVLVVSCPPTPPGGILTWQMTSAQVQQKNLSPT